MINVRSILSLLAILELVLRLQLQWQLQLQLQLQLPLAITEYGRSWRLELSRKCLY